MPIDKKPELRQRVDVPTAARRLATFLEVSTDLMRVMARACGHHRLSDLKLSDLTTWKREMADLSGVAFGGPGGTESRNLRLAGPEVEPKR